MQIRFKDGLLILNLILTYILTSFKFVFKPHMCFLYFVLLFIASAMALYVLKADYY